MRLGLVVLDGVFDSGLAMVRDAMEAARFLAQGMGRAAPFEVVEAGVRRQATTAHGRKVPLVSLSKAKAQLWFVPGLAVGDEKDLDGALGRGDVREVVSALKGFGGAGQRCAAACSSTFLFGEAGLLDGQRATTTWWLAPAFRRRFPDVKLDETQMVVSGKKVLTAGAALAHLDAALALVSKESPRLARAVAERLVLEPRPSQAPFIVPSFLAGADPMVEKFETWVRARLGEKFSVEEAAKAIGVSPRTLERKVASVLGQGPLQFVQALRVEKAVHLLKAKKASLEEIAAEVGYSSGVSLGAVIRKRVGVGVRGIVRGRR